MAHINANRDTDLGTLITHTAASTGVSSPVFPTHQGRGIIVFVNVTALTGATPSLTVTIKGCIDGAATATYTLLASSAITATGLTVLTVYPTMTAVANSVAQNSTPIYTRIDTVIGGTTPGVTATVSAALIY